MKMFLLLSGRGRLHGSNKGKPSGSRVLVVHVDVLNSRSAHTRRSRTLLNLRSFKVTHTDCFSVDLKFKVTHTDCFSADLKFKVTHTDCSKVCDLLCE